MGRCLTAPTVDPSPSGCPSALFLGSGSGQPCGRVRRRGVRGGASSGQSGTGPSVSSPTTGTERYGSSVSRPLHRGRRAVTTPPLHDGVSAGNSRAPRPQRRMNHMTLVTGAAPLRMRPSPSRWTLRRQSPVSRSLSTAEEGGRPLTLCSSRHSHGHGRTRHSRFGMSGHSPKAPDLPICTAMPHLSGTPSQQEGPPTSRFHRSEGLSHWWQVKDSKVHRRMPTRPPHPT